MITIEVHNVKSIIHGLNSEQNAIVYDKLSYEDDQTTYLKLRNTDLIGIDMRKRLFQPKRCIFPTGLLYKVIDILGYPNVKLIDKRIAPDKVNYFPLKVPFPEMRYYQKEAEKIINNHPHTALEMATGTGKSYVILDAIQKRGVNSLVIVPTLNLLEQFHDDAEYHFGAKFVGTHKNKKLKPITIANIQGLVKKEQEFFDHFQYIITDEYHHTSSDSYYDLNKKFWNHVYYKLSVSATGFRNDGSGMKLEAIAGPVLYSYKAKQAVKDGYIVPPHFVVYTIKHFGSYGRDWHWVYENCLVKNKVRNDKIIEVVTKFLKTTNKNILVLANRIEHVDMLAARIPDSIIVTGETDGNKKKFENYRLGKIRCMVATGQCLSEGVNIPNIDILVLAGGYESEIAVSQAIGRAVRLDPDRGKKFAIVIDFLDKNEKILERHSKSRISLYKELYGKEYVKILD